MIIHQSIKMSSHKKISIVMFSMSSYAEWQRGVVNRNYHILHNLLKNDKVDKIVSVDYLPHTLKRLYRNWRENILPIGQIKPYRRGWLTKIFKPSEKLWVYSTVVSKISSKIFYRELNKFLKKQGFEEYIVWSYYPLDVEYFKALKPLLFIFDTVDNWAEHPSYLKQKQLLLDNYKTIDNQADAIFTVSSDLQSLFENSHKVYWLPNGVDLKHYEKKYTIINRDIGEIKKPIIGYIGTIQDRLDLDLLEYLAKNNPDKSLVLVGPVWYAKIIKRLENYANVYFLGRKSYAEVPMYLQQFNVGIIPHKVDKFIKSTNPMKMYDYLACKKPVVSTAGGDVEQFKEVVDIASDYGQFNLFVQKEIAGDNAKLKNRRLEKVKDHSWLNRVEAMLKIINQKL